MIMIPGSGSISNYINYIKNCQANQMPYKIPINSLDDVQLYIAIGAIKPDAVQYEMIHTCGTTGGTIESITPSNYVVGQDTNLNWYGVFKNFSGTTPNCFVIAITLTFGAEDKIYFSEEYCLETCKTLILLKGCYGHLANKISYDEQGIYFGTHDTTETPMGDITIKYDHQILMRSVEVSLSAIKNTFKQGLTRTFRTEKQKIYQFYAEFIPEWYMQEVDSIFTRGEVYVGSTKWLVDQTGYDKIEDCKRMWKPSVTFIGNYLQSFSCEADPCAAIPETCCDPTITGINVSDVPYESVFPVPGSGSFSTIIVIQTEVGGPVYVTGTSYSVTGITAGSTVISCLGFSGKRIYMERGGIPVYDYDPGDGSTFYTKNEADTFITLSDALATGEALYIQTID